MDGRDWTFPGTHQALGLALTLRFSQPHTIPSKRDIRESTRFGGQTTLALSTTSKLFRQVSFCNTKKEELGSFFMSNKKELGSSFLLLVGRTLEAGFQRSHNWPN